jgi:hypothetical protein
VNGQAVGRVGTASSSVVSSSRVVGTADLTLVRSATSGSGRCTTIRAEQRYAAVAARWT